MKTCTKCKEIKTVNDFYKCNRTVDKLRSWCKSCESEANKTWSKNNKNVKKELHKKWIKNNPDKKKEKHKKWSKRNPAKIANKRLIKRYGIDLEKRNTILNYQNNKCAICGVDESDCKLKLHVDHNHTDGNIRGLLCASCNQALGLFKDSIDVISKAINYLQTNGNDLKEIIDK